MSLHPPPVAASQVLQIALRIGDHPLRCFVLDLLALDLPAALDPPLAALFTAPHIIKLGDGSPF